MVRISGVGLQGKKKLVYSSLVCLVRLGKPYSLKDWLDDQVKMRGYVMLDERLIEPGTDKTVYSPMDLTDTTQKSILLKSLGYR